MARLRERSRQVSLVAGFREIPAEAIVEVPGTLSPKCGLIRLGISLARSCNA